ncbi:MAG: hypothetical protein ABI583_14040 [Betaproteobacteria bacterium]
MSDIAPNLRCYDIRLITVEGRSLLFVATVESDWDAIERAKDLMLRHICDTAEVWDGMKLIRRL